ncbi:alpha/beta hydrolase [Neptunitalea lumnitzerae]|uniref:Endo-1,4-beta-xylanase n=1 Tax=Neptunitalea lumnitzerae TaxID=2965509 RepID=A0ABQ5MN84_9FLAO|nr:alpha/beta hydrolase family protein [Neptunitalea sp. Y10]GLB50442.1 endo-1,4-beta-xylanase [Neptunitalea sp. Y10]
MKFKHVLLFMTICMVTLMNAQAIKQDSIQSNLLKRAVSYSIYLPENYNTDQRSYPVIYLLHGYGDNHTTWIDKGNIAYYANEAIKSGKIPPVIIVMPDAGVSMYVNNYDGTNNYEDFFIKEFIPAVENQYRIKKNKYSRAITGHSMGGWGCMLYALKYPDLFVAVAPMSAGIHDDEDIITYDDEKWEIVFGDIFGHDIKAKKRLNKYWYQNSILNIVEETPKSELEKVRIRISSGDQDFLLKGSLLLHLALSKKQVYHQLRIKDGAHTWQFWRSDIPEVLEFLGGSFW